MSTQGADTAGKMLAGAAMIAALGFAVGFVLFGLGYFLN